MTCLNFPHFLDKNIAVMEIDSKLQSLECHFNVNWDLDVPTNETLDERIRASINHIKYNSKDTLPESYCHHMYLESLKDYPDYDKMLEYVNQAIEKVTYISNTNMKYFNNIPIGSGMKAVVLANKAICLSKRQNTGDDIDAKQCYDEYNKIKESYLGNLAEHPEVLLVKAFSLRASINLNRVSKAANAYEQVLGNIEYWSQVGSDDKFQSILSSTLYSLVLSKYKSSQDRTLNNKEIEDIEILLRRIIQIDPKHHNAILKLAELLANKLGDFALDEVYYYIEKAEKIFDENKEKNIVILEGIATVYENMKYGKQIKNKERAIVYYQRAKEINPKSRRSLLGLSMCHHQLFKLKSEEESNEPSQKKSPTKNKNEEHLHEARISLESYKEDAKTLKHGEKLELASIYVTLTKVNNNGTTNETNHYLEEAEKLYKEVISKTKKEGDQSRLLEAYAGYAELFDYKGNTEVVKNASNYKYDNTQVQKCVLDSQTKLLSYADKQQDDKKFNLKGWVQMCRGKIHNAVFYFAQAIQKSKDQELKVDISKSLISLLLKASDQEYQPYHERFANQLLEEGVNRIEKISDTNTKSTLMYEAMCIEAKKNMGNSDETKRLLELRHNFEKNFFEYIKDMAVTKVQNQKKKDAFSQTVLDVVSESKRLLDQGMDMIKQKVYGEELPFCYYPSPQKLDSEEKNFLEKRKREDKRNERERNKTSPTSNEEAVNKKSNKESAGTEAKETLTIEEKMKCLLEGRYKWEGFSDRFPGLFQYLVDKQPVKDDKVKKYKWLQDFISVRDEREHNHKHKEIIQTLFTSTLSQRDLARNCSNYAAEVWKIIKAKIDSFEAMEICRKELKELYSDNRDESLCLLG